MHPFVPWCIGALSVGLGVLHLQRRADALEGFLAVKVEALELRQNTLQQQIESAELRLRARQEAFDAHLKSQEEAFAEGLRSLTDAKEAFAADAEAAKHAIKAAPLL